MADEQPTPSAPDEKPLGPFEKVLGVFSDVKGGEGPTALLMLVSIFILLLGYYVLKTVREPLVLASAASDLEVLSQATWMPEWLRKVLEEQKGPQLKAVAAGAQALILLAYLPFYSLIAAKFSRIKLIAIVTIFFVVNIELFFVLRLLEVPLLGFFFYIWVGIFSVSMIATFWSFGNDIYSKSEGERLFPIVAIGQTAGAPAGSYLADKLFESLDPKAIGMDPAFLLMQICAVVLIVYLVLLLLVNRREETRLRRKEPAREKETRKEGGGFALIFKSPYLLFIAFLMLVLNIVNTNGEFILSDYVVAAAPDGAAAAGMEIGPWIGSFYGEFFTYVNIIGFLLQAFVVSRIVKYTGLKGILFILPFIALGTYGLFAAGLTLATVRWAKTAENSTDYSIMNTGRAMMWLPTTRDEKYKAKQVVDTFFVRMGDVAAAVIFIIFTTVIDTGVQVVAGVNIGFILVWLLLTYLVIRGHAQRSAEIGEPEPQR